MVATTFWETFFLFLIFLPLAMVWAFALVDIFRREDLNGWAKALWVTCVVLLPFLGTLIYLIVRPSEAARVEHVVAEPSSRYAPSSDMSQLATLADLHDRGKLTDDEFAAEKARLLGTSTTAPL